MTNANLINRLHNYPDDHLLTRAEAAHIVGVSTGVLCNHSYAGLLPFIPGRPIHVRAGDLKLYLKLRSMNHGQIHRSLKIEHKDRQAYSPLHGVVDFQSRPEATTIQVVLKETGFLWKKFKELQKAKKRRERGSKAA